MNEETTATAWLPSYTNMALSSDEPPTIALRQVKRRLLAACTLGGLLLSLALLAIPVVLFLAPYVRAARGGRDEDADVSAEARRDVDHEQFCEQPVPRFHFSAPTTNATATPIYDVKLLLQRPVICVLQNKHFRQQFFYQATFVPFEYCTYVVLQFFHVTKTNPSYRTSHDADFLRSIVRASRKRPTAQHVTSHCSIKKLHGQSDDVPILLGLGVDESDSSRFHHMVVADTVEVFVRAAMVHVNMDHLSGVHVNWLYPGDLCGDAADKAGLLDLLQKFRFLLPLPDYTLTVAVSTHSATKNYDLQGMLDVVDYIVVHAPDSYSTIACHFNRTAVVAAMYRFAKTTGLSRKREPVDGKMLVATYETMQNLQQRFDLGFADGIGGQCVAVYDLELDDYFGRCKQGFSPHLRVIAVEGIEEPNAKIYSEIR
ncbi:hypothetical protein HPB50_016364 [Hyalomma asiaticum]|uniref:Uncharacterized protein n=1 Tax=Hyalomma asiaticum TaxID=266040 RepID=A0ACB7SQQ7_HYAAI|nr:hypothetical protein HPB50_016364 [Hyalomma asiaticum]